MPTPLGRILIAATPIGNVADASPRLREALTSADLIAAEDTRRLLGLCSRLGVKPHGSIVSLHEHNEASKSADIIERVLAGAQVLVVSDAGTPTVSDPGYRLVRKAIEGGVEVTSIPGPSAVLAALAVSGLPTDRFTFEGFLPRKPGDLRRVLEELAGERRTMVIFESAKRLAHSLTAMAGVFGAERPAVVARELTKTHEEVVRGGLEQLAEWASGREVLGEITVVVGGGTGAGADVADLARVVVGRVRAGERARDVVAETAAVHGVSRRVLYQAFLEIKGD